MKHTRNTPMARSACLVVFGVFIGFLLSSFTILPTNMHRFGETVRSMEVDSSLEIKPSTNSTSKASTSTASTSTASTSTASTSTASTSTASTSTRLASTNSQTPNKINATKNNIVFVKTHKTASSAVQNVLLRYGLKHNLRFALPKNKHDFSFPHWFSTSQVALHGDKPYNIICHHMRFHYDQVRSVMPNNSVYVTIMREPGLLFESTFDYLWPLVPAFQQVPHNLSNAVEEWLDHAEKNVAKTNKTSQYSFFSKNPTIFDLGYDNQNEQRAYVQLAIAKLDRIFDLVLISDYMDESMILLADLLGWDLKDVACLYVNARASKNVSDEAHARISKKARAWNAADTALFDHFNATLWVKMELYGHRKMAEALKTLKSLQDALMLACVDGGKAVGFSEIESRTRGAIYKPQDVAITGYNLKKGAENVEDCKHLLTPENAFSNEIFNMQMQKYSQEHAVQKSRSKKRAARARS